jgi:hypothetical protein
MIVARSHKLKELEIEVMPLTPELLAGFSSYRIVDNSNNIVDPEKQTMI